MGIDTFLELIEQIKFLTLIVIDLLFEVLGKKKLNSFVRNRKSLFLGKTTLELTLFGSKSDKMKFDSN